AQDLAAAGAGERVLEVDRGERRAQHEFAGGEVVQRDGFEARAVAGVVAVDAEGTEGVGDAHRRGLQPDRTRPPPRAAVSAVRGCASRRATWRLRRGGS